MNGSNFHAISIELDFSHRFRQYNKSTDCGATLRTSLLISYAQKPAIPTTRIRLQPGIEMPGPAPVNVAADASAVGEPELVADEAPSVSDAEPDSASPGIVDVDVVVSTGGVFSVGVVFGFWLSAVETSEASAVGLLFV